MNRFAETLRPIQERLDLPQPVKSRILLEVYADLEDLYETYRSEGCTEEEAERRAIETCQLSDHSLDELVQVHTSPLRHFIDSLGQQARSRWERGLLVLALLFIVAMTGRQAITTELLTTAGPLVIPVLLVSFAGVVLGLTRFYHLFIRKDHDPRRLRTGLTALLLLAAMTLIVGAFGFWLETFRVALRLQSEVGPITRPLAEGLISSSALLMVAILKTIVLALLWFVLADKVARIEQAEASVLLLT